MSDGFGFFKAIADLIGFFFSDLRKVAASIGGIVSLILGAIADPTGFLNNCIVGLIDFIALFWPSTPESLQISSLLSEGLGGAEDWLTFVVYEVAGLVATVLGIVMIVKIYKLIPFKFT